LYRFSGFFQHNYLSTDRTFLTPLIGYQVLRGARFPLRCSYMYVQLRRAVGLYGPDWQEGVVWCQMCPNGGSRSQFFSRNSACIE